MVPDPHAAGASRPVLVAGAEGVAHGAAGAFLLYHHGDDGAVPAERRAASSTRRGFVPPQDYSEMPPPFLIEPGAGVPEAPPTLTVMDVNLNDIIAREQAVRAAHVTKSPMDNARVGADVLHVVQERRTITIPLEASYRLHQAPANGRTQEELRALHEHRQQSKAAAEMLGKQEQRHGARGDWGGNGSNHGMENEKQRKPSAPPCNSIAFGELTLGRACVVGCATRNEHIQPGSASGTQLDYDAAPCSIPLQENVLSAAPDTIHCTGIHAPLVEQKKAVPDETSRDGSIGVHSQETKQPESHYPIVQDNSSNDSRQDTNRSPSDCESPPPLSGTQKIERLPRDESGDNLPDYRDAEDGVVISEEASFKFAGSRPCWVACKCKGPMSLNWSRLPFALLQVLILILQCTTVIHHDLCLLADGSAYVVTLGAEEAVQWRRLEQAGKNEPWPQAKPGIQAMAGTTCLSGQEHGTTSDKCYFIINEKNEVRKFYAEFDHTLANYILRDKNGIIKELGGADTARALFRSSDPLPDCPKGSSWPPASDTATPLNCLTQVPGTAWLKVTGFGTYSGKLSTHPIGWTLLTVQVLATVLAATKLFVVNCRSRCVFCSHLQVDVLVSGCQLILSTVVLFYTCPAWQEALLFMSLSCSLLFQHTYSLAPSIRGRGAQAPSCLCEGREEGSNCNSIIAIAVASLLNVLVGGYAIFVYGLNQLAKFAGWGWFLFSVGVVGILFTAAAVACRTTRGSADSQGDIGTEDYEIHV